jgi:uroporphyrinogen decarboxylase
MLNSRERVLTALDHQEPDRVPIFFGTSGVTTMLLPAYERFKELLGVSTPQRALSRAFQYAQIDEEVMRRLGADGRPLIPGPAASSLGADLGPSRFRDDWGVEWVMPPGAPYYHVAAAPLAHAAIDDLESFPWPDFGAPGRTAGLRQEARRLVEDEGCATVLMCGASTHELISMLRGLDNWLVDLVANKEFAHALLRKMTDLMVANFRTLLDAAGDYVDIALMADDLGTQDAPLMSPRTYREMIKPYQAEQIAALKGGRDIKLFLHTDGNVYPLIGDFIEIGVDILNPVQVSAREMGDTARLKREFGRRLSFCGAIDTHRVLPQGRVEDVRAEVRRRIRDLAPGGGYILSAVHCIQPDVPAENALAMFDEAKVAGQYPIRA